MGPLEMLISVIIPVSNEELTVGNIIERVKMILEKIDYGIEITAVDDCSEDQSLENSKKTGVKVYSLRKHMGKGYALRVGFAKAKGEIIVTIDSNESHRPEELPLLLSPILHEKADLIIGSRYLNQKSISTRKINAFGVSLFDFLIRLFTKKTGTDSQSGYRVMKSRVLRHTHLKSGGYEIESEMLVKIARRDFRVSEVPISFQQRTYGRSGLDPLVDGFKILLSIVLAYTGG